MKATMRCHYTHNRMTKIPKKKKKKKKNLAILNADENSEPELLFIAGDDAKMIQPLWKTHW